MGDEEFWQPDRHRGRRGSRRRLAFETNPESFAQQYAKAESALRTQIEAARLLLPSVTLPDSLLDLIAEICIAFDVDGMRADLVMHKTARTVAAWEGLNEVTVAHVQKAAEFALLHRRRRQPFEQPGLDQEQLEQIVEQHQQEQPPQDQSQQPSERESSTPEQEEDCPAG